MPGKRVPVRYRGEPEDVLREFWPLSVATRKVAAREAERRAQGFLPASSEWDVLLAADVLVATDNTTLRLATGDELEGEPPETPTQWAELQPTPWSPALAVLAAGVLRTNDRDPDAVVEFLREAVLRESHRHAMAKALRSVTTPDAGALLRLFDAMMA